MDHLYSLRVGGPGPRKGVRLLHMLYVGPRRISRTARLEQLIEQMENDLALRVAALSEDEIFVHAGVVAIGGRAVLMPGVSGAGKSTLVKALMERGATYYSDEFALVDARGMVHPYPRRMSLRKKRRTVRVSAAELGAESGDAPIPVGLVLDAKWREDGQWRPTPLSLGKSLLTLVRNAVTARSRPEDTFEWLSRAVKGASGIRCFRGEADEAADGIIRLMAELYDSEEKTGSSPRHAKA